MNASHDAIAWRESRLVDVGGRSLALKMVGEGVPPVVLEMGLGAAANFYEDIAWGIAAVIRVV